MKRVAIVAIVCGLLGCGDDTNLDPAGNNGADNNANNNTNNGNNTSLNNNNVQNNSNPNNQTGENNQNNTGSNNGNNSNNQSGEVTYHKDVRPLVEKECQTCHVAGGIAPFALTTFEQVSPLANLIAMTTQSLRMPPWPPQDGCGEFQHERTLDPAEIQILADWAEAGAPLGDESDYVAPTLEDAVELGEPDYVLDIGTDYTPTPPNGGIDDYRCFIIEPNFTEDKFINAFETHPGDRASVHHMLFWQIEKDALPRARAKESSPGSGYTCFGSNGLGAEEGLLGGWVPGTVPVKYNDNQGFRIPQDSFIVVQIHYNTLNGANPDRTKVDLHFTDGPPAQRLGMYPVADADMFIPAGAANGKAEQAIPLPFNLPVFGVVPHMHTYGSRIRVTAKNGDDCLIDIPDWDFNWQGLYLFKEPVIVEDSVRVECWYDNSAANQPPGETPKDITWGEGTYDEMCLNYFITVELSL